MELLKIVDFKEKILARIHRMRTAFSVIRPNPIFNFFSYQLRLFPNKLNSYKNILVVGACGGLGKAICENLIEKKCNIYATYNKKKPNFNNTNQIKIIFSKMNISNPKDIKRAFLKAKKNNFSLDLIIIASGFKSKLDYRVTLSNDDVNVTQLEIEKNDLLQSFEVNTIGPYLVIRQFSKLFLRYKKNKDIPQILILSSSIGTMNSEIYGGNYSYRTSKGAMHSLGMAIFCDLNLNKRIGFSFLGPGDAQTKMNPFGKISAKEAAKELVKNIEYLSKSSKFQFIGFYGKRIPW